jgi:hypothetical protein
MGKIIVEIFKALLRLAPKVAPKIKNLPKPKLPPIGKKLKDKFPKSKPSCKQNCPAKTPPNPYKNMPREKVLDSKKSYEKLIREHEKKLADYRANPQKYDNLGKLKNSSTELQKKMIDGRIKALEKQLTKQRNELKKIEEALK